jgi:hypothetical protein
MLPQALPQAPMLPQAPKLPKHSLLSPAQPLLSPAQPLAEPVHSLPAAAQPPWNVSPVHAR